MGGRGRLGVNQWTLIDWEQDRKQPMIRMWIRVIKFLGYYPFPEPQSLGERLLAARRHLGICHGKAATLLAVYEGTYLFWERGRRRPTPEHQAWIEEYLVQVPGSELQAETNAREKAPPKQSVVLASVSDDSSSCR